MDEVGELDDLAADAFQFDDVEEIREKLDDPLVALQREARASNIRKSAELNDRKTELQKRKLQALKDAQDAKLDKREKEERRKLTEKIKRYRLTFKDELKAFKMIKKDPTLADLEEYERKIETILDGSSSGVNQFVLESLFSAIRMAEGLTAN